jgi:hypothetical protein
MEVAWCSDHGLPHSTLLSWSPEDRAKLTAHLMESAQRCQMCGTAPWEWEEDRHAYEGAVSQCWGCYIKDRAGQGEDLLPGASVVLVPRRVAEARRAEMVEVGDL